jgi:O-antigen ligase
VDIRSIENGIPSVLELRSGIFSKINYYLMNLHQSKNPNGNSLLQRLEYWRVGSALFKKHPIIGVGIGDYKSAFAEEYEKKESLLTLENRLETHQQFLSVLIATGCIGGIVFALIFYFYLLETSTNPLAIYFIGIILASFLVEDTLTTLAGMSFFALFYTLFQTSIPPLSGIAEKC